MDVGTHNDICSRIQSSTDSELQSLLDSLSLYDSEENYAPGVSIDDLANDIRSEITRRSEQG